MDPALGYGGLANEIKLFTLMRNSYQLRKGTAEIMLVTYQRSDFIMKGSYPLHNKP